MQSGQQTHYNSVTLILIRVYELSLVNLYKYISYICIFIFIKILYTLTPLLTFAIKYYVILDTFKYNHAILEKPY